VNGALKGAEQAFVLNTGAFRLEVGDSKETYRCSGVLFRTPERSYTLEVDRSRGFALFSEKVVEGSVWRRPSRQPPVSGSCATDPFTASASTSRPWRRRASHRA
jgi:hypothetical protein